MNIENLTEEIKNVSDKIKELRIASKYGTIDYELLEKLEEKESFLMKQYEELLQQIEGNNVYNEEGWKVPMPSKNNVISDKKMDYKTLGLITLISNRKTEFIEGIDFTEEEQHRYLYEQGDNSILSNKDFLEEASNNKLITIKRNLKKLANCNNDVVSYCEDEHGKYYKIMPYTLGDNGTLQYVTIDSRVLEYLINASNSNGIKIYCVLLWVLWDNKNKCYVKKQLTYDWLLKQIGLSGTNGGKNFIMLNDILITLESVGLIKIDRKVVTFEQQGYNSIVKKVYYYEVGNIGDFLAIRKRGIKK